jgi:PAS domain S-box-containing protein
LHNDPEQLRREVGKLKIYRAKCHLLEDALQKNEDWFYKIFHASSNPMSIVAVQGGRIVDVNGAFLCLCGFEREELIGRNAADIPLFAHHNQFDILSQKIHEMGRISSFELEVLTKTGESLTLLFSADSITVNDEECMLTVAVDITAHIRESIALKRSEENYRQVVEHSLQGLLIVQDGRIAFCNTAFAEMTGYSVEEIVLFPPDELAATIHPDDQATLRERTKDRNSGMPLPPRYEIRMGKKDGSEICLEAYSSSIEYNGKAALQTVFMDISGRKLAEAAAIESRERLLLALQAAGMASWDLNNQTGDIADDAHWLPSFGYQTHEIEPNLQSVNALMHPDDLPVIERAALDHLAGKTEYYSVEYRIRNKSGSWVWIMDRGKLISRDSAGNPLRTIGVHFNISELRNAAELIKESKEYFNQIINCIADPIFVKDREHKFLLLNDAFCNFDGRQREELLGKVSSSILPEEIAGPREEQDEEAFSRGAGYSSEDNLPDQEGRIHSFLTKKSLLKDKDGSLQMVGVLRDITELKRLQDQFVQSQKMEAIGMLAGGVAHDFNNLLTVIKGYAEVLAEDIDPADPKRRDLEQILKAGSQAASLTSQLLAFSRKQILQPEILDLNAEITHMSSMVRRLIGENIKLAIIAQPELGSINADPGRVQQIILNLAVNARDAMPNGGRLTLETANVNFDNTYVKERPVVRPGPYIMLAISDNGVGMDSATQARIFEPFFTTKEKGKGTGLGLSTVYGIVKQSDGFIWVYSEPANGTTFKIYFPRVEGHSSKAAPESDAEQSLLGSETVLVVEDEDSVRNLTCRILKERGYSILEASNGKEALEIALKYSGDIHLVITDVVMPEMGGKALVTHLQASRPGIRVLFVSGYTDNAIVHHGILDPDVEFLQKPFGIETLARKVRKFFDS